MARAAWKNGPVDKSGMARGEQNFIKYLENNGYTIDRYKYTYTDMLLDISKDGRKLSNYDVPHGISCTKSYIDNYFNDMWKTCSKVIVEAVVDERLH